MMYPISGMPVHPPLLIACLISERTFPRHFYSYARTRMMIKCVSKAPSGWREWVTQWMGNVFKVIMWNSGFPLVSLVLWPETPSSPCATRCLDEMIHNKNVKNLLWIRMRFSILLVRCSNESWRTKVKCASLKIPFLLFPFPSSTFGPNKFTRAMFTTDTISILPNTDRSKHWSWRCWWSRERKFQYKTIQIKLPKQKREKVSGRRWKEKGERMC